MTYHRSPPTWAALIAAVVASISLAACNRADEGKTVGQKIDSTVAKAEQKTDELKADARTAGQEAKQATTEAMDSVSNKVKDAAITTSINAELAKDAQLSALHINVDTVDAKVVLHGTAPDAMSRERAAVLAARVDGVKSVDNQLMIDPKR